MMKRKKQKKVKLEIVVKDVILLKSRGGQDRISLSLTKKLAKRVHGQYSKYHHDSLSFNFETSAGRGEAALGALGITEFEIVNMNSQPFRFSK